MYLCFSGTVFAIRLFLQLIWNTFRSWRSLTSGAGGAVVHNVQSPNRRLNHLRGMHSRITGGKNSKSYTSIQLWCTKGMLTRFYGAQKSLPSATWRDDCHGTCETLRSAERQGPTDSEPVELANSTTPLILYRLQKESNGVKYCVSNNSNSRLDKCGASSS